MWEEIGIKISRFWRERCREEQLLSCSNRRKLTDGVNIFASEEKSPLSTLSPREMKWKFLWKTTKSIQKFVENEESTLLYHIDRLKRCNPVSLELASCYYQQGTITELQEKYHDALIFYQKSFEILQNSSIRISPEILAQLRAHCGRLHLQESLKLLKLQRPYVVTECLPVDRCEYGSISYSEFLDRYAIPSIPLIFTSAGPHVIPSFYSSTQEGFSWSLESIMATLGNCTVTPKEYIETSTRWAKQEDAEPCKLSAILSSSFPDKFSASSTDLLQYLVDWSLPQHCPQLFQNLESNQIFQVPKYFSMDVLQLCPEGSIYKDTWPSLFIGPKGSQSSLHVDTFGSNFWMFLIHGRKRWRFYSPGDLCVLSPSYPSSFEPVFSLSEEEIEAHGIKYYEVVLNPGELIFVPSGSPHSVINLEGTVAISCNYIDESNYGKCMSVLANDGILCPRSGELRSHLEVICGSPPENPLRPIDSLFWIERRQRGDRSCAVSWKEYKSNTLTERRKRKMSVGEEEVDDVAPQGSD